VQQLHIAMIGQRGVPATFGGVEHHVEELGSRMAALGHDIVIFCRKGDARDSPREHLGMRLWQVPTVRGKGFAAIVHSALSTAVAVAAGFDVIHYHAVGPTLLAPLPRYLARAKVISTVHGLDAERAKWGPTARAVLLAGTWVSGHVPDATIAVSQAIATHYRRRYRREASYIPNGVTPRPVRPARQIARDWGLRERSYVLFVGRIVPEKAPDLLVRAFRRTPSDLSLVVTGGSSDTDSYM
jgi:glycosyltransferase involved in cell wall biosynthesis